MGKNIAMCFDGTNNTFGHRTTNVLRIAKLLDRRTQAVYYDPGVGTLRRTTVFKRLKFDLGVWAGLGLGYGIFANVSEAYQYLMATYDDGDQIFLFGFSRGAYTARLLAGLVQFSGLLHRGHENLIPHILDAYTRRESPTRDSRKKRTEESTAPPVRTGNSIRKHFSRVCLIRYAGLFDSVNALGRVSNRHQYPYSDGNAIIAHTRHALALDERRGFYRPPLMYFPNKRVPGAPDPIIEQVWFAGVHSDVGGGYPDGENGLARLPLEWVLTGAVANGLCIHRKRAHAKVEVDEPLRPTRYMIHETMNKGWPLAEVLRRQVYNRTTSTWEAYANHGRSRDVRPGSRVHASLLQRMEDVPTYRPHNLPDPHPVEPWVRLRDLL